MHEESVEKSETTIVVPQSNSLNADDSQPIIDSNVDQQKEQDPRVYKQVINWVNEHIDRWDSKDLKKN